MIADSIANFFLELWIFLESIIYWLALFIGIASLLFFFVTKENKYKNRVFVAVLGFIMIKAVGYAI